MEEVIGGWTREGVLSAETERVSKISLDGEIDVVFGINANSNCSWIDDKRNLAYLFQRKIDSSPETLETEHSDA